MHKALMFRATEHEAIDLDSLLGEGTFGKVYKGATPFLCLLC